MEGVSETNISRPKYSELLNLVSSGRLSIVFILGLARGGTTAVEKHLYAALSFDANVNEPTLRSSHPYLTHLCNCIPCPFCLNSLIHLTSVARRHVGMTTLTRWTQLLRRQPDKNAQHSGEQASLLGKKRASKKCSASCGPW